MLLARLLRTKSFSRNHFSVFTKHCRNKLSLSDAGIGTDRFLPNGAIAMHATLRITISRVTMLAFSILSLPAAAAEVPDVIAVRGEILVETVHAVGAQIYECKSDSAGRLGWQFREPIATLLVAGKSVGRHYAGPNWEMSDGSAVVAKVAERAPAASASDIPLLKLEVSARRGNGQLSDISTIQRINTKGGVAEGACEQAGALLSVPYTADYTFYRKRG
jgi:hypothetical protein